MRGAGIPILLLLVSCRALPPAREDTWEIDRRLAEREISLDRMMAVVRTLAADGMRGRRFGTPEGRRAARRVAGWMREIGLKAVREGYRIPFEAANKRGWNVAGMLEGADPKLRDEFVVVCAHHDHLGEIGGAVFNGADDNASGVAVLLEVARAASKVRKQLRRSVLFVSFDGEEAGLLGSRAFVKDGPISRERFAVLICLDLLGGNFTPRQTEVLFALGAESSPEVLQVVRETARERRDPVVTVLGVYAIEPLGWMFARSDYGSFRAAGVPFVFLSTGTPWYYHTPEDDVERMNGAKLQANARLVFRLLLRLAQLPERPSFRKNPPPPRTDAKVFAGHLDRLLAPGSGVRIRPAERERLEEISRKLRALAASGGMKPEHKRWIQEAMRIVFGIVRRSGSPKR